jgi:hypothetical protein
MEPNWASDHLQVIRTLMERVAMYRRALAPITLAVGVLGTLTAAIGAFVERFATNRAFALLWVATAAVSLITSYFLARRQALKDQEPFWSPPTRRVSQALLPGFLAGGMAGLLTVIAGEDLPHISWLLALGWIIAYGCALHAAGFFMERGFKLFGLAYVLLGSLLLIIFSLVTPLQTAKAAHLVMGLFFGVAHLAYGGYLHLTEQRSKA